VTIGAITPEDGKLRLGPGGILQGGVGGGGLLAGANIMGTVDNQGGQILPGFSPGILSIDGDFIQRPSGLTVLEVAGTLAGVAYDQIIVMGDAQIEGSVTIEFVDGFAPREGDIFDFFQVGGEATFAESTVRVEGLEDGFEFDFGRNDVGALQFVALNDGVSASAVVPEPSTYLIWIGLGACVGLARWRRRGIHLPS
jgi:hypothetical protein